MNAFHVDPFSELRQAMDQLFEHGFSRPWRMLQSTENQSEMAIDVWESDDALGVAAALPGVRPDDVEIAVTNGVLTIKGQHHPEAEDRTRTYHRRELYYGTLNRALSLPYGVDSDKAEARFENGILYLRLPKAEAMRPKQIKIGNSNDGHLLN